MISEDEGSAHDGDALCCCEDWSWTGRFFCRYFAGDHSWDRNVAIKIGGPCYTGPGSSCSFGSGSDYGPEPEHSYSEIDQLATGFGQSVKVSNR